VFGEEARAIARELRLEENGDLTDVNTKIVFERTSVEGRIKITIEFDI